MLQVPIFQFFFFIGHRARLNFFFPAKLLGWIRKKWKKLILYGDFPFSLDVFHAMHPASAYEVLANNYLGDLANDVSLPKGNNTAFADEMRDYRDKLEAQGFFQADKGFYTYKLVSTVMISVLSLAVLRVYGHSTTGVLVSAFIMGMFWQQCGWLSHDFAHHQVFEDRSLNDVVVVFLGNLCQGFSLSW